MIEARLLCLEYNGIAALGDTTWRVANGGGVPITEGHIPRAPPSLVNAGPDQTQLLGVLTNLLGAAPFSTEPGWSRWQLDHIGEIKIAKGLGGQYSPSVKVVVKRDQPVRDRDSSVNERAPSQQKSPKSRGRSGAKRRSPTPEGVY